MKVKEIRRHPDCAPGTWWWTKGELGPTVSCPDCQALHQLNLIVSEGEEPWFVDPDGRVHPSVVCQRCGWHSEIRLLGWTGNPP